MVPLRYICWMWVVKSTLSLPDTTATVLSLQTLVAAQPSPEGFASNGGATDAVLTDDAAAEAALHLVRELSAQLVIANATQSVEASWVGGELAIPSDQTLDVVALRGYGELMLLSVATKTNVGTGLVKSSALHRLNISGTLSWERIFQAIQLYGEGADDIRECERGHHVNPAAVISLRNALGHISLATPALLAVLTHAALSVGPMRAENAEEQALRNRYDATLVARAVAARYSRGSCDDDEAAQYFSADTTIVEGLQLGLFDAGRGSEIEAVLARLTAEEADAAESRVKSEL